MASCSAFENPLPPNEMLITRAPRADAYASPRASADAVVRPFASATVTGRIRHERRRCPRSRSPTTPR